MYGDAAAPGRQLGPRARPKVVRARPRARAPAARSICGSAPAVPEGAEGFTTGTVRRGARRGVLSSVRKKTLRKHRTSVLGQPSAFRVPSPTVEFHSL
jgi:hypothetical protein